MANKENIPNPGRSVEWFLRGALTRLGDKLDGLTGRKAAPASSLATSQLVERLKLLLDSKAMEMPEKGWVIPHDIKIKVQWDKFSTGENDTLEALQKELTAAVIDHINDRLYYTLAPVDLQVVSDYFIDGIQIIASFKGAEEHGGGEKINISLPSSQERDPTPADIIPPEGAAAVLKALIDPHGEKKIVEFEIPPGGRVSIGRTGGNALVIDDASVSKFHASLNIDKNGDISIADTGSTNGTFIGSERMAYGKAVKLMPTDIVKLGSVEVSFGIERLPVLSPDDDAGMDRSDDNATTIHGLTFSSRSGSDLDSEEEASDSM